MGVGALSRDFMVGMCPLCLVTRGWGTQLGFRGAWDTGALGGIRTCPGGLAWQTLAGKYWGTIEGSVKEWSGYSAALERKSGRKPGGKLHSLCVY